MANSATPSLAALRRKSDAANLKALQLPSLSSSHSQPEQVSKGTKDYADSGVLLLSLIQSRQNWITSNFQKYRSDPVQQPRRSVTNNRKKWPNLKPLGSPCTFTIGPHSFQETQFYEAIRTEEVPQEQKLEMISDGMVSLHPIDTHALPETGSIDSSRGIKSDVEERLIIATSQSNEVIDKMDIESNLTPTITPGTQTANYGDQNETNATPGDLAPSTVKTPPAQIIDLPSTNGSNVDARREFFSLGFQCADSSKGDMIVSQPNLPSSISASSGPAKLVVRYDLVFEFKENPNERFIFPKESIVEKLTAKPPFELLISFHLPQPEPPPFPLYGSSASGASSDKEKENGIEDGDKMDSGQHNSNHSRKFAQAVNMRIYGVTEELWQAIQKVLIDPAIVCNDMMERMHNLPGRVYLQYRLPRSLSNPLIEELANKQFLVPDIGPSAVREKRKASDLEVSGKSAKRVRKGDQTVEDSRRSSRSKPLPIGGVSSPETILKTCAYCGSRSTPMWRRGPQGAGTLCNACGVKWKHGKILQGKRSMIKIEHERIEPDNSVVKIIPHDETPLEFGDIDIEFTGDSQSVGDTSQNTGKLIGRNSDASPKKKFSGKAQQPLSSSVNLPLMGTFGAGGSSSIGGTATITTNQNLTQSLSTPTPNTHHGRVTPGGRSNSPNMNLSVNLSPSSIGRLVAAQLYNSHASAVNPLKHTLVPQPGYPSPMPILHQQLGHPFLTKNNATGAQSQPSSLSLEIGLQQHSMKRSTPQLDNISARSYSGPQSTPAPLSKTTIAEGILLPTLSITFPCSSSEFKHPNCGVSLFDNHLQILLNKDGFEKTTLDVWKESILSSEFQISAEKMAGDLHREVLEMRMNVDQSLTKFETELLSPARGEILMVVKFLEKVDDRGENSSSGGVVRRIVERWLGIQNGGGK